MTNPPHRILVVANVTVGGRALIDAVRRRAEEAHARGQPVHVTVICPQNRPRHGLVVYDDSVRAAAENRLRITLEQLRNAGIEATGEVMDPDPFAATMDALQTFGADEIIISTHPETRSGWMRRHLVDRIRDAAGVPVEHVVVDLDLDRKHSTRTLVVANQTVGGDPLIDLLVAKSAEGTHSFIVISPQGGAESVGHPKERLDATLERMHDAGLEAIGQVMDPDPFTAIMNALHFYAVDEIVISTFPGARSGWLRSDLIERIRQATALPVEHVVVSDVREGAST